MSIKRIAYALGRQTFRAIFASGVFACCSLASAYGADKPFVAITQIVEHPALDAVRKGVVDELAARGFVEGTTLRIEFQSAQGSPVTASQIARKFSGDQPAVIVAISTPSAQAAAGATKTIPIVFSAVTDPVAAKLLTNLERPGGNISGVSAFAPIAAQLDLIRRVLPNAKRLGVIYNAGEVNSVAQVERIKQDASVRGLTVVEATTTKSGDVGAAAESLVGKVDAVHLPTDNTVTSALEAVVKVAQRARLPLFGGDATMADRGVVAALGFDWYAMGRDTGAIVGDVLKGRSVGTIPVAPPRSVELRINERSAEATGVVLGDALLAQAKRAR